ncbi:TRAP transporter substrate-binding protein [Ottowia thiooxydans]|uniref:TRAP transporter substrate-binding protein n=1 Tax=Ottowia thiooxydans TaxID=219182 RepID=UPI0003FB687D|nr:TRAP transporter substrate-binding protein [Ottowia thiooxydans]
MKKSFHLAILAALTCTALAVPLGANAQVREHTFRISTGDPSAAPGPMGNKRFAELVAKASGGKMKVKTYDSAMLGNDVQMQGMLQGGTMDFALVGAPTLGGLVKEFGVLDFPFSFRNVREVDAMLDGPMGTQLLDKLKAKGLIGLGFWEIGFRQVTNSRRAITKWEDLDGLKIRTVQSPVFREFFNSTGANAVPMAINEVYTALETKAIDAQENPPSIVSTQKFFEVQKHLSLTNHIYTAYVLLASQKSWDKLNADERKILTDAAASARSYERQIAREQNSALLVELRKQMTVNELSPAETARFAEKAKPVQTKFSSTLGEDFVKAWLGALDQVRATVK